MVCIYVATSFFYTLELISSKRNSFALFDYESNYTQSKKKKRKEKASKQALEEIILFRLQSLLIPLNS